MNKQVVFALLYGVIGIGVISLWIMLISANQVPEFETEPVGIVFHIIIEILMALSALATALLLLKSSPLRNHVLLLTNGMLIYSVVNSAGYYGDAKDFAMIGMFAVIFVFVSYTTQDTIKALIHPTITK